MTEYRIRKRARACTKCETPFAAGDLIVSTIREGEEGFVRDDLCESCHGEGGTAFSTWRSRQPPEREESKRLDYDLALRFLDRLLAEADPAREGMVYALTLLLSRKRRVKIRDTRRLPDGELLVVQVPRDEDDEVVQVRAPALDDAEADRLQNELAELFDFAPPPSAPERSEEPNR